VTAGQGPAAGGTTRLPATGAKGGAGVATLLLGLALLGRAMARRSRALG
jgi:hypothetical protein